MSDAYSSELNDLFLKVAAQEQITLHRGIYTAVCGSSLETRAEYRYLRFIGTDVVGMSTIPEVIACKHANLPVAAISVITDECDPDNLEPIDIDDILKTAADAEVNLITLFKNVLIKMR
jgi:purine-nucleoside phosphorylase